MERRVVVEFVNTFDNVDRIELLERSLLVNSYAYYVMSESIMSDFTYDKNARQLVDMKKWYPDDFKHSRYYPIFHDFEGSTGFDLIARVNKDQELQRKIIRDVYLALFLSKEHTEKREKKGDI